MSKDNKDTHFNDVCNGICVAHNLDAAVLVTVKSNKAANTASIELHGDGPNEQAVAKMKEIISTSLFESIKAFNEERAKAKEAKQEATNAG